MIADMDRPPQLADCSFCGKPPEVVWRKFNPRAGCKSEGCMGAKLPAISLDLQEDIDRWNTRSGHLQLPSMHRT